MYSRRLELDAVCLGRLNTGSFALQTMHQVKDGELITVTKPAMVAWSSCQA